MEATQFCAKCKKNIITTNYMLHQAMCRGPRDGQLFRSRVINPQQELWDQVPNQAPEQNCQNTNRQTDNNAFKRMKSQTSQLQPQQNNNNNLPILNQRQQTNLQQPGRSNIGSHYGTQNQFGTNPQIQKTHQRQPIIQEQRISCPNCGYKMSLMELDTHPSQCKVKTQQCNYCNSQYPKALIRDHKAVCTSRPRQQTQNRRGISQEQSRRRPSLTRRGSNRETLEHYHYRDPQTGQQMCARVTQDQQGNRYTDTHAVQEESAQNNNPFSNMGAFSSLNALFGNMFGMGSGTGGTNIQIGGNNGMNRVNFIPGGGFSSNSFQQMIFGLMNRMNVRPQNKVPLSKQLLNKLPVVVFDRNNPDHQASTSCTVCMTDFEDGDQLILLPCGHLFNKQCIVPWLKGSSLCPNCRQPIKASTKPSHSNNYQANQNIQNNQTSSQNVIQSQRNSTRSPNPQQTQHNFVPTQTQTNTPNNLRSQVYSNTTQTPIQQNTRTNTMNQQNNNRQNQYPNLQSNVAVNQNRRN